MNSVWAAAWALARRQKSAASSPASTVTIWNSSLPGFRSVKLEIRSPAFCFFRAR